jgi:hypothetical protein
MVGIYLLGPNDSVLGDVIMSVRYACVVAPRQVFLPVVIPSPPPTAALRGTLAYVRDGNIYGYNLRTKQTRLVVTNGRDMQFSPDGTQLAFIRDDGVYLARADGSTIRRIAALREAHTPQWTDDGTKLLWERTVDHTDEIWTVALPQGTPTKIATGRDPAWAPDSLRVAYVTVSAGATNWNHLRLVNWQGQNAWAVVTTIPANTPPIGIPGNEVPRDQLSHMLVAPVWNAQGTAIYVPAYVLYQALSDFFIWERADATHGGSVFVSELPPVDTAIAAPDRRAVIFTSSSPSGATSLVARSLDPSVADATYAWAERRAEGGVEQYLSPAWAPDSAALAVVRCRTTCDVVVLAPNHVEPQVVVAGVPPGLGMGVAWGHAEE